MSSSLFRILISLSCVIVLVAIAGCGGKSKSPAKDRIALMPPDGSVMDLPESAPPSGPQQPDVLPSQDDAVAALIRKSEDYARELKQVRDASPRVAAPSSVMTQQTIVKPPEAQQTAQKDQTQPPVTPESGRPPATAVLADANTAVPMTTGQANVVTDPPVVKLASSASDAPAFSSDVLQKKLLTRVKDYPRDVAGHLEYQLMQFLKDQQTPEMASLGVLPAEDRELVAAVMDGMTNFRNQLRSDNNMLLSKKIRPLVELSTRLQSQAELSVPTIALCTRVDGFGKYDPIDPPRFAAGKQTEVIVYCEVANFTSRIAGEKNFWQTDLTQEIVLYSEGGQSVWTDSNPRIQDVSRVRRHDFFVRKMITLPATLPVQRYLVKVTITDQQANRVAEASLPLQIMAQ